MAMPVRSKKDESTTSNVQDISLPLYRKLLLTAAMTANEVCVSFEQLFQVPLMQILGVPITFVSVYPIVMGPLAMVLMNLLGHLSDKGSNQHKKKIIYVIFNTVILAVGIALVVVANYMYMLSVVESSGSMDDVSKNNSFNISEMSTTLISQNENLVTSPLMGTSKTLYAEDRTVKPRVNISDVVSTDEDIHGKTPEGQADEPGLFSLSTMAVLSLVGFCLLDLGFDLNQAAIRSCVLACSPKQDHASLLLLALAMAALGGCITNVLGLVDLSAVLDFGPGVGSLPVQTTVQLGVCFICLMVCVTSTIVTALYNIRHLHNDYTHLHNASSSARQQKNYGTLQPEEHRTTDAENECGTKGISAATDHNAEFCQVRAHTEISAIDKDSRKLLPKTLALAEDMVMTKHCEETHLTNPENWSSLHLSSECLIPYSETGSCRDKHVRRSQKCCGLDKRKMNFVIVCATLYLGPSVFYSYNMFVSNYLGKVVMGGDSSAPEGSAELKAYEDGVELAAGGLIMLYCSFMVVSIMHSKLLKFWGVKTDVCLSQFLMGTAIVCLLLSRQVGVFYLASILYGFQRSALLTVPFILADNYSHEQSVGEDGKSRTGRTMAVVGCMIPFNYCTIYLFSGPVITLTHYDGAPLIVAAASAYLAAFVFFLHERL